MRHLLDTGANDEAVCDAYDRLLTSLNGPTAMLHRLAAASFVCARRPHLTERILQFPALLFLEHGVDRAEAVIAIGDAESRNEWVAQHIAGPDGVQWLREELPCLEALVGRLLWEAWALSRLSKFEDNPPMTAAGWFACEDAGQMLEYLERCGRLPCRRRALLASEVCRAVARLFRGEETLREVVGMFEQRIETWPERAADRARDVAASLSAGAMKTLREITTNERRELAVRVRDIFGNPFRLPPTLSPAWLQWNDGTVGRIAQAIYDEGRFEDLPILADALEDAGCDNADILAHCRQPGEHVRGCWVVDVLLGKG